MELMPIWYEYATFDESGHVNGIRDDAPQEMKEAYSKEQERRQKYIREGKPIPR